MFALFRSSVSLRRLRILTNCNTPGVTCLATAAALFVAERALALLLLKNLPNLERLRLSLYDVLIFNNRLIARPKNFRLTLVSPSRPSRPPKIELCTLRPTLLVKKFFAFERTF